MFEEDKKDPDFSPQSILKKKKDVPETRVSLGNHKKIRTRALQQFELSK